MSVTEPKLPRSVASVTVSPPLIRFLLAESLSCTVMVEVEIPSDGMGVSEAVIVEVAVEAGPMNVTGAISEIPTAFTVPVMVAIPSVTDEVSVAV